MAARYLKKHIENDALQERKMAFIAGPRQVGKTYLAKQFVTNPETNYYTWDDQDFRVAWSKSPVDSIANREPGVIVLDEIHKDRRWKSRLKGVFDKFGEQTKIIVTGSARLDLYRKGGDSLMGRYIPYHLHPFSVAETSDPCAPDEIFTKTKPEFLWDDLMRLSGFPEPLLGGNENKAIRWSRLRRERLVQEDVRDLRAVSDLQALGILVALIPEKVGSLLSINNLRADVGVAYGTVYAWMEMLESLYHHFLVRPYAGKLKRTLRAEPKLYLFDHTPIKSVGAKRENLIALHLLKACHFWTDGAFGNFELRFIRNKEKEEVDFCVLRDGRVWMLVECKSNCTEPTKALIKFTEIFKPKYSLQLVSKENYDRSYAQSGIKVLSIETFCAGLL